MAGAGPEGSGAAEEAAEEAGPEASAAKEEAAAEVAEEAEAAAYDAHASVHFQCHARNYVGTHDCGGGIRSAVICEKPTLPLLPSPMTLVTVTVTAPGVPETATVTGVFAEATL